MIYLTKFDFLFLTLYYYTYFILSKMVIICMTVFSYFLRLLTYNEMVLKGGNMQISELLDVDMMKDLGDQITAIDVESISDYDLINIAEWVRNTKEHADLLTLEDELVGFTYSNLDIIMPKINRQQKARGMTLTKTIYKHKK